MYLLKKTPVIVEIAVLAFGMLFFAMPVQANSCQCFEKIQTTTSFMQSPLGSCVPNIYSAKCNPIAMGYPELICEPNEPDLTLCHTVSCVSYRDNSCQEKVGDITDTSSVFNNCWTEAQCDNVNGDFDSDRRDSSNCTVPTARCFVKTPNIDLQIPIPGYGSVVSGGFPGYLAAFYKFFIAMLAVVSVVMVMWGGFKRIMAAGSPERIKDANDAIISAITGLILALISYTLLNLVNPSLVNFTRLKLDKVKTELFGNWCPDPDPMDKNKHYECGDKATVGGMACIGMSCPGDEGKGCFKTGKDEYQCMLPQEICEANTISVIQEIYNLDKLTMDTRTQYNNICERYSSNGNRCLGEFSFIKQEGGCRWFSEEAIASKCSSFTSCDDFIILNNIRSAYSIFDLCNKGCDK